MDSMRKGIEEDRERALEDEGVIGGTVRESFKTRPPPLSLCASKEHVLTLKALGKDWPFSSGILG